MQVIIDVLSSPTWQGVQALLAFITIIISLRLPRKWLENQALTSWVLRIPWITLFLVFVIGTSIGISIKYQNVYMGLSLTLSAIIIGIAIQWKSSRYVAYQANSKLNQCTETNDKLLRALRHIARSQSRYGIKNWKITHVIDENGNESYREKCTIRSLGGSVFLYFKYFSITNNHYPGSVEVSGKDLRDDIPLSVIEFEKSKRSGHYGFVLEPPITVDQPKQIVVECKREGIWKELINTNQDEGFIEINWQTELIELIFIAPPGKKWQSFRPSNSVGNFSIEMVGDYSQITWVIQSPPIGKYNFALFLKP